MATTYDRADDDIKDRVQRIIKKWHPDLHKYGVTVDLLLAHNGEDDPVKLHGYPCAAVVRKVSYKNRVLGRGDSEIIISAPWWQDATEKERDALIDHELTHLVVKKDDVGAVKTDDCDRPKLMIRLHDWQLGGFREIVDRHGDAAPEKQLAVDLREKFGQLLFDFAKV